MRTSSLFAQLFFWSLHFDGIIEWTLHGALVLFAFAGNVSHCVVYRLKRVAAA